MHRSLRAIAIIGTALCLPSLALVLPRTTPAQTFSTGAGPGRASTPVAGLWERAPEAPRSATGSDLRDRRSSGSRYLLDETLLESRLDLFAGTPEATVLPLPLPDGRLAGFRFAASSLMEPGLAGRYPQIRTYRLHSPGGAGIVGHAVVSPLGLHAMILTDGGPVHVTPAQPAPGSDPSGRLYTSRFESDLPAEPITCGATGITGFDPLAAEHSRTAVTESSLIAPEIASGDELRTYRLAVATTAEYYNGRGGNDADVLASIVVEVSRLVSVYESEVAISFVIIGNTDDLFFTDADAYTNDGNACALKDENQGVVDGVLADGDYDIALVLDARSNTAGGCASGSGVCVSGAKARVMAGMDTTQAPGHEGFGGYRLIAHEVGHIFGAGHTWSGQTGNCTAAQYAPNSAYEPGGGTTIMSYSGTCGPIGADSIQGTTGDPYFHIWSIDQIVGFATGGAGDTCAQTAASGNQPPTVNAGPDFTIPRQTPFVLSGSATDPDGDDLTTNWEQFDLAAGRFALGTDDGVGPIIRSRIPDADSSRTVPPMSDLISGTSSPGELLPQVDRTLTFRLTARDNLAGGGGVNDDTMVITVEGDPFALVSPNGGEALPAGCPVDVEWTVGGGDVAAQVDLDLTRDDGATFQPLAAGVDNDGFHTLDSIGCLADGPARMRASAVGNIFFDISDNDFSIVNNAPEVTVNAVGGAVDDACLFEVTFTATVTDDCGVSTADVDVEVTLLDANAALGAPTVNLQQVDPTTVSVTGSVMVSDLTGSPARVGVAVTGVDACGNDTTEADIAEVVDLTPPTLDVMLSPDTIWPPNHKMVDIAATVLAEDNCDTSPEVVLLSVTSDEPENGLGDGNTAPDIDGVSPVTPDFEFRVRAERQGMGDGRVYTATYGAADDSGNMAQDAATVTVPKSRK